MAVILPNQLNYITEFGPNRVDAIYPSCRRVLPLGGETALRQTVDAVDTVYRWFP